MGLRIKPNKKESQNRAAHRSTIKCSVRDKRFTTNGNSLRHKRLLTSSKPLTRSSKLKILENTHKQSRFPCRYCKDGFPTMDVRRTHIEQVHNKPKKTNRTNNVGNRRKHNCDYCGYNMANSLNVNPHKFILTGEIPSQCELSSNSFRRKDLLKDYSCHSTNVKNPYICDERGLLYNKSFGVIRHMSQSHPAVNIQPYVNQISKPKTQYSEQRQTENRAKIAINTAIRNVLNIRTSAVQLKKKPLVQKDAAPLKSHSQRRHVRKKKIVLKKNLTPPLRPNPLPKTANVKEMERDEMEGGDAPLRKTPFEQTRSSPPIQPQLTPPPKKQLVQRKCIVCSGEMETDHNLTVHTPVFHPAKGYGVVCGICQKPVPTLHLLSRHYEYCHSDDKNAAEEAKILLSSSIFEGTTCQDSGSSPEQDEEKMKEAMEWPLILQRLRSSDTYTVFYNNVALSQKREQTR